MQAQRHSAVEPILVTGLAEKGAEALRQGRFKEAMDLYRQLVRKEPRPEWRQALNEAYAGRARALAAKEMFKEAAIVLENTIGGDGLTVEPALYVRCLVRSGQSQKAARYALRFVGGDGASDERRQLEDVAAVLALVHPEAGTAAGSPEMAKWLEIAAAARQAIAAWTGNAPQGDVDRLLAKIPLSSAFGPVRLILKSLLQADGDKEKAARLLSGVPSESAFGVLKAAVEELFTEAGPVTVPPSAAQHAFASQMAGISEAAARGLGRLAEAEAAGPAALYTLLLKQNDWQRADVRAACLNLLPHLPDRIAQFERSLPPPLTTFERGRIVALAAELRSDWRGAERAWLTAADALQVSDEPSAKLAQGIIYRHLSELARGRPEVIGSSSSRGEPGIEYLQRSLDADPDCRAATLELMSAYQRRGKTKELGQLADAAARRFPGENAFLQRAMEAAAARKAFKLASDYAQRLLAVDPINTQARLSMITLGLAQARKHARKKPQLALKHLAGATKWERPTAPSGELRIASGLLGLHLDEEGAAERIREGVRLLGGGVLGWTRAEIEMAAMRIEPKEAGFIHVALKEALKTPPTKELVVAVLAGFSSASGAGEKLHGADVVLTRLRPWLLEAASLAWSGSEFYAVADVLQRFSAFGIIADFASLGSRRDADDPVFSFYRVLARVSGKVDNISPRDAYVIAELFKDATEDKDAQLVARIERFMHPPSTTDKRQNEEDLLPEGISPERFTALLEAMFEDTRDPVPVYLARLVRKRGFDAAIAEVMLRFRKSPLSHVLDEAIARFLFSELINGLDDSPF